MKQKTLESTLKKSAYNKASALCDKQSISHCSSDFMFKVNTKITKNPI